MKKFIFLILSVLVGLTCSAQMSIVEGSFYDLASGNKGVGQGSMGVTNITSEMIDWPVDADGEDTASLLIVNFENMGADDINKVMASLDKNLIIIQSETKTIDNRLTRRFFIPEANDVSVTFSHEKFGATRLNKQNFKRHGIYAVTLRNAATTSVSINSSPEGAKIRFDGKEYGVTPKTIPDVQMGKHTITLEPSDYSNCKSISNQAIDVTSTNSSFHYDLYKKRNLTIQTIPSDSHIKVTLNNNEIAKGIGKVEVKDVSYLSALKVTAVHNDKELIDDIIVKGDTDPIVTLNVIGSRMVTFNAKQNNSFVYGASVSIDGQNVGKTPTSRVLEYGRHKVDMAYGGITKAKTFRVDKNTKDIVVKLPNYRRSAFNPFDCDYQQREWGLAFNYVNRYYVRKEGKKSKKYKYNGEPGSNHGMQIGLVYQPYFAYGQGLSTGIYWQGMFDSVEYEGEDHANVESSLYIPLQYQFRLPLHENTSIAINAGAAMTCGLLNSIEVKKNSYSDEKETVDLGYGYNEELGIYYPDRLDFSLLFGVAFQFKALQIEGKYSIGLKDHKISMDPNLSEGASSYKTGSMTVGLSFLF